MDRQRAERDVGVDALYVMFYPQLVAGPIERPQHLLHQLRDVHRFDYARVVAGLQLMAWGLVKKVVVADRLAELANRSAQVMGFDLMKNFDRPYTARSVSEFWRRWHISLSTWFRDYLYVPLGGSRVARPRWYANLFIVFLVSGLWHGARWTFVVWGALHGAYLIGSLASADARARLRATLCLERRPALLRTWQSTVTFALVGVAWVFFRATSLGDAWYVVTHLASGLGAQLVAIAARDPAAIESVLFLGFERSKLVLAMAAVIALLVVERVQGRDRSPCASGSPARARRCAGRRTPARCSRS